MNDEAAKSAPDFARVENGALAGKFVASFWQPIAMSKDCVVGIPKRVKIIGNYHTLYRGEDNAARLVQDRCPHRGTSLAFGWVEGNGIRCRYHGWKFDGAGRGQEFPAETATYAAKICLKTYPIREYLGMIFAFLGEGEPPEFTRFPELEDESRGELLVQAVVLPYNFFQRVENDHDEVHGHYTHVFMKDYGLEGMPRITGRETEYGMVSIATRADGTIFTAHGFMPNILFRQVPIPQDKTKMTIHLAWRVPIDDATTLSFMVNRVGSFNAGMRKPMAEAEDYREITRKVMNCEMTLEDVDPNHPLLPVIQDTVSMGGQGVIADRSGEHLGQSDRGIALLRRIWAREMQAISEGKARKKFYRPADFTFDEKEFAALT
jgi:5,5'-dehydrodivanillate O-demethylase